MVAVLRLTVSFKKKKTIGILLITATVGSVTVTVDTKIKITHMFTASLNSVLQFQCITSPI